jgi:hypothetical protein
MLLLAVVRRAAERDFLIREAKAISRAALNDRNALEGLDGGAREDWNADVAC